MIPSGHTRDRRRWALKVTITYFTLGGEFMTTNQIAYYNAREAMRHNLETEQQGRSTIGETSRHNKASEQLTSQANQENIRHNRQSEGIQLAANQLGYAQLGEAMRHNLRSEDINWYSAQGLVNLQNAQAGLAISNIGTTSEANRIQEKQVDSNINRNNWDIMNMNESNGISLYNSQANRQNAETNRLNAETNQYNAQTSRFAAASKAANDSLNTVMNGIKLALIGG